MAPPWRKHRRGAFFIFPCPLRSRIVYSAFRLGLLVYVKIALDCVTGYRTFSKETGFLSTDTISESVSHFDRFFRPMNRPLFSESLLPVHESGDPSVLSSPSFHRKRIDEHVRKVDAMMQRSVIEISKRGAVGRRKTKRSLLR